MMERTNSNSLDAQEPVVGPLQRVSRPRHAQLDEWQQFFLDRLDHLIELQRQTPPEGEYAGLVSKAVYSTYLDCQTRHVGEQALQAITAAGHTAPSPN